MSVARAKSRDVIQPEALGKVQWGRRGKRERRREAGREPVKRKRNIQGAREKKENREEERK